MSYQKIQNLFGAIVIMFAYVPALADQHQMFKLPNAQPRALRSISISAHSGTHRTLTITGPFGCSSSNEPSFIGLQNVNNFAGYYSGVMAGQANEACDARSSITGGNFNVLGGDNYSINAAIVAGYGNSIEAGASGFIGGGSDNLLGVAAGQSLNAGPTSSSIVGGTFNTISVSSSFIGAGDHNTISGGESSISSGHGNSISGGSSSIGSGETNVIIDGVESSIVGGGQNSLSANWAFIGGGQYNSIITLFGQYGVISGGYFNGLNGAYASIAGGYENGITAPYGAVGGGYRNVVGGNVATIAGGYQNSASGRNAAIPGGAYNVASGIGAFAAGYRSSASNQGAFVWNDDDGSSLTSTASNQFLARASGGFYFYSSTSLNTGVALASGSGSWSTLSDRSAKTRIRSVDDQSILDKIVKMPVSEWSYTAQGTSVLHLGPMAQDFRAAFGLGEDDRHISTVDDEGVALAAIKALAAENASLRAARQADETRLTRLEQRLDAIDAQRSMTR